MPRGRGRTVVILAGGLGRRLKPFTETIPKPLLPVGEKSILEIQIRHLAKYGFKDVVIAVYYKTGPIQSFIQTLKIPGLNISLSQEPKPLGTCGPLSLLRDRLTEPFLVVNADILSNVDYAKLYAFGAARESFLTVATKKIVTPFNFGKVTTRDDAIVDIQEKPDLELEILAGIYVMKPAILSLIPNDTYFGIDHLMKKMLAESLAISRYLMTEYWLDIGTLESYNEAQLVYKKHFEEKR